MPDPIPPAGNRLRITARGMLEGARRMAPFSLASMPFGVGYGVAAAQKGLSAFETALTSALVFAGTSQMVALDLWAQPIPLFAVVVAVFVANLRYFVMGAALQPHLRGVGPVPTALAWYSTVDQNWALNIVEFRAGTGDLGRYVGGGLFLGATWTLWSWLGHAAAGGVLADPAAARRLGLDFVAVTVFVAMASLLFRGRRDVAPWLVAVAAAFAAKWLLPGAWYIVVGGVLGGLYGAWRDVRQS